MLSLLALAWRVMRQGGQRAPLSIRATTIPSAAVAAFLIVAASMADDAFKHPTSISALGSILAGAASAWLVWSYSSLGASFSVDATLVPGHALRTTGPYSVVRHPVYSGMIVLMLGGALVVSWWYLVVVALTTVKSIRQINAEEEVLERSYEAFAAYRQAVPDRLFPGDRRLP